MKIDKERGTTIWLTGLSGAGKSTIAQLLSQSLRKKGSSVVVLDGDEIRKSLWPKLSFSKKDRDENIRSIGQLARLLTSNKITVIVAFISPYRKMRTRARKQIEQVGNFIEIYIKCPLEECEKRDPKGLYKKARKGQIKNFTGISDPYEEPKNPEIVVDTSKLKAKEGISLILSKII